MRVRSDNPSRRACSPQLLTTDGLFREEEEGASENAALSRAHNFHGFTVRMVIGPVDRTSVEMQVSNMRSSTSTLVSVPPGVLDRYCGNQARLVEELARPSGKTRLKVQERQRIKAEG